MEGERQHPLTEPEYVAIRGIRCPNCGSSEISGGPVEVTAGGASQPIICGGCGADWYDEYELSGYSCLEVPEER